MSSTSDRRATIREILTEIQVSSQAELIEHLASRGVQTTQPVLSRDLRALKVAKRSGVYQILEQERITPLDALSSLLRSVQTVGDHLVVVRCEPGAASAVARALDSDQVQGMVGTVAGDDTVFLAVVSRDVGDALTERVNSLL